MTRRRDAGAHPPVTSIMHGVRLHIDWKPTSYIVVAQATTTICEPRFYPNSFLQPLKLVILHCDVSRRGIWHTNER